MRLDRLHRLMKAPSMKMWVMALTLGLVVLSFYPSPVSAAPTISIKTPKADEIVGGNVTVKGTGSGASSIELRLDSETTWHAANGTDTWSFVWNSSGYSDGYHYIYARAKNGTSTSDVASVRVYLNNSVPESIIMDMTANPLDIAPLENITVSGFVEYDTGVKLKWTDVTTAVLSTNISYTIKTDDNAYIIKSFQGPSEANTYTIRVSVTDGKLTAQKDFQLSVTTDTQPDLSVKSFVIDPVAPKVRDTVSLCATIENLGIDPASANIKFTVDGKYLDTKAVNVDSQSVVKATWVAEYGEHTLKVEIADVKPADRDLSNNQRSMRVMPKTVPDVYIVEVVLSNPSPRQGQMVTVMVAIENKGYSGTMGDVAIYDGDLDTGLKISSKEFKINTNETIQTYMDWGPSQGAHTLTAKVTVIDQAALPQHIMTKDVTVQPPIKKKKEETPAFGSGELVLCLLAVGLIIVSRRANKV